ncbi:MAG: DUF5684 domain-containing protein [Candidatus Limivicinus sp.]|jgi:hypothetical protein
MFVVKSMGLFVALVIAWYVLKVVADWKIFTKAGEAGWKSLIPFYNVIVEYDISWKLVYGVLFLAATFLSSWLSSKTGQGQEAVPAWQTILQSVSGLAMAVLHFIQSVKLSKAFGKGVFYGILLFLFGPIFRVVLGLGKSEYLGPQ